MAIISGPGTASVSSGSFTGPAEAIEIIGDHAYAYASPEAASNSSADRFNFKTGNYYFVGRITVNGSADPTGPANGNITVWILSLNGANVLTLKTDSAASAIEPVTVYNDIIIPAYTEVKLTAQSDGTSAGRMTTAVMTGRIYRG